MEKSVAIGAFGGVYKLAKAIGVSPQAIYAWRGAVPLKHQLVIERLTNGELKATLPEPPAAPVAEPAPAEA